LIATDDAGSLRANAGKGNRKSLEPCESSARGNGNYDGNASYGIETVGRNDQHGPFSLLFMPLAWIE
jgi:hypothetical protein